MWNWTHFLLVLIPHGRISTIFTSATYSTQVPYPSFSCAFTLPLAFASRRRIQLSSYKLPPTTFLAAQWGRPLRCFKTLLPLFPLIDHNTFSLPQDASHNSFSYLYAPIQTFWLLPATRHSLPSICHRLPPNLLPSESTSALFSSPNINTSSCHGTPMCSSLRHDTTGGHSTLCTFSLWDKTLPSLHFHHFTIRNDRAGLISLYTCTREVASGRGWRGG